MIATRRTAALRYSTDTVAAGLTAFVAPCAARTARRDVNAGGTAPLDFARLYPQLICQAPHAARGRTAGALAAAIFGLASAK